MTSLPDAVPAVTAVDGTGRDAGAAWHYGDPLREQRHLSTGAVVVDRANRDVLVVTGPDRLGWLHTICSQHVSDLRDGDVREALVLSPHGHVEQHWVVTELDDTVWIDTEPHGALPALDYLTKMRFLKRVEPADVSADWSLVSLVGPAAETVAVVAGFGPPPTADRAVALPSGGFVRRVDGPGVPELDFVVPRAGASDLIATLRTAGAHPAGMWAYEAARVTARRPRFGAETDHRTIPHEVGWIGSAVHLDKGCYRGQETVARVQNLGRPPRRLVLLHLSGESDVLPETGAPVELDGRQVGFVGTAVHHFEEGPIALAVIKRSLVDSDSLYVNGYAARIDAE